MSQAPMAGLGQVKTYSPLTGNLSQDPQMQSIKAATAGGSATANYFTTINNMNQLFQSLASKGSAAWTQSTDTTPIKAPVSYVVMDDAHGKPFYIKVGLEGVNLDSSGNVQVNGSTAVINGVTYNGIGAIKMTCGYSNYTFSKTSWWAGTSIAGAVASKVLLPKLFSTVKSVANVVANNIKAMRSEPDAGEGGEKTQGEEEGEDASGNSEIIEEGGGDVVIDAADTAIAWGGVFIGVGIVLAIIFVVLSFALHNTYHNVRIWNLTNYTLTWTMHFDTSQIEDQGELVSGPVVFQGDKVQQYVPFEPIGSDGVPGVAPTNSAHYGDMSVNSSHEFSGIGYVLQFYLQDDSGNTVYTATMYFDIPFAGTNSTNVTLGAVSDLQGWYKQNNGNNKKTQAVATSDDGVITATTTYDYLSGEHAVPNTPAGSSSNQQYFYQSLITIAQNNVSASNLQQDRAATVQVPPANPVTLPGLHPKYRNKVLKAFNQAIKKV